jgi:hypothetical protein
VATNGDRNNDLVAELKERLMSRNRALDEWQQAQAKVVEAKRAAGEWRDVLAREETALREVEHELLTGVSSVPLIAAAQARPNGIPPPDVVQITMKPGEGCSPRPGSPAADRVGTYDQELDWLLHDALGWGNIRERLAGRDEPPTNDEIEDELKNFWGHVNPKECKGYRVRAFPAPGIWLASDTIGPAALAGKPLYDRIRAITAKRTGADLVTSRPGSSPATNGVPELEERAWGAGEDQEPKKGKRAKKAASAK